MNNKVVIGGNLKLKNVVSGQAKLNNVISGTPNTSIRAGGRGGISNAVKEALLDCFEHVAWIDDDGQAYYQALYDALYARTLTSISAVFEQGQVVIYDDDTLNDLKQYLTVTAHYDDGTTEVVTTYTLSGTLTAGTSTIQVTYEGKKAYFNVTVTGRPALVSISALYTQSGTVKTNTPLDSLKADLVVTATYSDSSTATVPSADYTLSGTLTVGTSTITVAYGGQTATFNVTVSDEWDYTWLPSDGTLDSKGFTTANFGSAVYGDDGVTITGSGSTKIILPVDNTHPKVVVEYVIQYITFSTAGTSGFGTQFTYNDGHYSNIRTGTAYGTSQNAYGISRYTVGSWTNLPTPQFNTETDYTVRVEYDATGKFETYVDDAKILSVNSGSGTNTDGNVILVAAGKYLLKSLKVKTA